jgi:hypothetical protein
VIDAPKVLPGAASVTLRCSASRPWAPPSAVAGPGVQRGAARGAYAGVGEAAGRGNRRERSFAGREAVSRPWEPHRRPDRRQRRHAAGRAPQAAPGGRKSSLATMSATETGHPMGLGTTSSPAAITVRPKQGIRGAWGRKSPLAAMSAPGTVASEAPADHVIAGSDERARNHRIRWASGPRHRSRRSPCARLRVAGRPGVPGARRRAHHRGVTTRCRSGRTTGPRARRTPLADERPSAVSWVRTSPA